MTFLIDQAADRVAELSSRRRHGGEGVMAEIDAALAWANEPLVVIDDHDLAHDLVEARFNAGILASEVRRYREMRCDGCRYYGCGYGSDATGAVVTRWRTCSLWGVHGAHAIPDEVAGCFAWEKKDEG